MRQVGARLGLGFVLLAVASCAQYKPHGRVEPAARDPLPKPTLTAPQLVSYLNTNAKLVQAVRSDRVDIDAQQDGQKIGLSGSLACQKPRNFRLVARVVGNPAVDIGSNNDEFWYWINAQDRKGPPPYVYHCSYTDLARGVSIPFPFQPDMVIMALGIANYDETKSYQLKEYPKTLELIEQATSPQGRPVQKVTIFNRNAVDPRQGTPQVLGYALLDERGKPICKVSVRKVSVDRGTGAILPRDVTLVWPEVHAEMRMQFNDMQIATIGAEQGGRLFRRTGLKYESFDLARRAVDSPGAERASYPPR